MRGIGKRWRIAGLAVGVAISAGIGRAQTAQPESDPELKAADLQDGPALVLKLRDARDPVSSYLRDNCRPQTQSWISEYTNNQALDETLRQALLKDLNRLLWQPALYTPDRFAGVALSPETKQALLDTSTTNAVLRRNRLLIEDAYPDEINRFLAVPLDIRADTLEYQRERNLMVGTGHVVVRKKDEAVRGDRVIVNLQTDDVLAEGNVTFERESDLWVGQKLSYNFRTEKGDFGKFQAFLDPFYIQAVSSERISEREFLLHDVTLSTCEGDNPTAHFHAKTVRIDPGHHIYAEHIVLYLHGVPVMYAPYWAQNIGDPNFISVVPGFNSRMWAFLLTTFNWRISRNVEAASHIDVRIRRGVGVGQDFLWSSSGNAKGLSTEMFSNLPDEDEPWYFGEALPGKDRDREAATDAWFGDLITYYAYDAWPDEGKHQDYPIDSNRYRLRLYHNQSLDDENYLLTQLNYLSDPKIIEQYFREEFKAAPEPDNYLILGHRTEHYTANIQAQGRLNDFFTTVDRLPELSLDVQRQQIAELPFYAESETTAGYLMKQWESHTNADYKVKLDDYSSFRFDTDNTLYYPTRQFGFLSVIPRVGYRGTAYSETKEDQTNIVSTTTWSNGVPIIKKTTNVTMKAEEAKLRSLPELGGEISFKAFKIWETHPGLIINNVRHIAEPYMDYSYIPDCGVESNQLYQFDAVDGLGWHNQLKLGMRNKIQTKRDKVYDLINADIWTYWRLEQPPGVSNDFDNIYLDIRSDPFDWLQVRIDGEIDEYEKRLDELNTRVTLRERELSCWSLAVEHRYLYDSSSLLTPTVTYAPFVNWKYSLYSRYEFEDSEMEAYGLAAQRTVDCVTWKIGFEEEDDEYNVWFQFWFTEFPKWRVGVGM